MKTEWTKDEIHSLIVKMTHMRNRMEYCKDTYQHPGLSDSISAQFHITAAELKSLIDILQGNYELKESDPQSGSHGMNWYLKKD